MSYTEMVTHSKIFVDLQCVGSHQVNFHDIAHSLALQCRFNGHCDTFYSVAQHSMGMARMMPREHAIYGLLHDAHEAYLGDIIRPVSNLMRREMGFDLSSLKHEIDCAVWEAANLVPPSDELEAEIKRLDAVMLATEHRDLINDGQKWNYGMDVKPRTHEIIPLSWRGARAAWLDCLWDLEPGLL